MIICNLFFIFDPSLSLFSRSWLMLFSFLVINTIFYFSGVLNTMFHSFYFLLSKEISFNLPTLKKGLNSFLISLLTLILFYNFLALFPHLFSTTSHLLVTLPLAYTIWLAVVTFNLVSFFKYFLSHFIPLGTPIFLISFMVIVEILRNLIRPLALTFRLTANIIAGHLLISLVRGILITLNVVYFLTGYFSQFFLVFIEIGVSFIQAYVFFTLLLLYASEGKF